MIDAPEGYKAVPGSTCEGCDLIDEEEICRKQTCSKDKVIYIKLEEEVQEMGIKDKVERAYKLGQLIDGDHISSHIEEKNFQKLVDGEMSHFGDALLEGKKVDFFGGTPPDFSAPSSAYCIVDSRPKITVGGKEIFKAPIVYTLKVVEGIINFRIQYQDEVESYCLQAFNKKEYTLEEVQEQCDYLNQLLNGELG